MKKLNFKYLKKLLFNLHSKIIIIIINLILLIINNKYYFFKKYLVKKKNFFDSIISSSINNKTFYKIKGISYLNKCKRALLTNRKKRFPINNFPKISIIIPIYNCNNSIQLTISSIQNQNFLSLEIILVNDFSSDNSLQIISKIQKEDKRIKILNNKRNMGTLYSRCLGVLKSKGKYKLSKLFIKMPNYAICSTGKLTFDRQSMLSYDIRLR